LKVWAQKLGIPEAAQLLDKTLHEEKDADENLSALMVSEIHVNDADDGLIVEPLRADVAALAYWTQQRLA
jgi:hypothetical protein